MCNDPFPSVEELQCSIRNWWSQSSEFRRWSDYVNSVLPNELGFSRRSFSVEDPRLPLRADGTISFEKRVDLLVVLVGHSFEPLLQAICVYRPRRVQLILNKYYGRDGNGDRTGERIGEDFRYVVKMLQAPGSKLTEEGNWLAGLEPIEVLHRNGEGGQVLERDSPGDVFQFLRKVLGTDIDREKTLIDITGAKKSMAAGAYLFASMTGVPVTYVDFDEYDLKFSRPWGYTCRIGKLENPFELFRLRDWQRVSQLTDEGAYRSACEVLKPIVEKMEKSVGLPEEQDIDSSIGKTNLFDDADVAAALRLNRSLEALFLWSEGNYTGAAGIFEDLCKDCEKVSKVIPTAVTVLSNRFGYTSGEGNDPVQVLEKIEKIERGTDSGDTGFYQTPREVLVFAWDECAKIKKLIASSDHREAIVRSQALHETLLRFRFVQGWFSGMIGFRLEEGAGFRTRDSLENAEFRNELDGIVCARYFSPSALQCMLRGLKEPEGEKRDGRDLKVKIDDQFAGRFQVLPNSTHKFSDFWTKDDLKPDQLEKLRNKGGHFYLGVGEPVAKRALGFAMAHSRAVIGDLFGDVDAETRDLLEKGVYNVGFEELVIACGLENIACLIPKADTSEV